MIGGFAGKKLSRLSEVMSQKLVLAGVRKGMLRRSRLAKKSNIIGLKLLLSMTNIVEWLVHRDVFTQAGVAPHDVIYREDILSVLHYKPLEEDEIRIGDRKIRVSKSKHKIPLVCVPPLLAPGFVFDLFPDRSMVRYFLARGFDVYLIDFGSPDKNHAHLSFEDYILDWMPAAMKAIRARSGEKELSLYGYCMGGLFTLLYTAVHEDGDIRNIITAASPIDMHQMGMAGKVLGLVSLPAHLLARGLGISVRDLSPRLLHVPGKLGTLGFYMTNPLGVLKAHWDLLLNLWDRDFLVAHESLEEWIDNLLDYPGGTFQEIIVQMALANTLARKGSMTIGDREAVLKHVGCSILAFAGENDEIVPAGSARKILDVVSSDDKKFFTVPGGHVGLIMGHDAPEHLWQMSADWLASRSG